MSKKQQQAEELPDGAESESEPEAAPDDGPLDKEHTVDFNLHADEDGFRNGGRDSALGEFASRLLRVGAEAVTQTTGRLREAGEDVRPRDLVSGAVRMTAKGREELVGLVAKEVRMYLEKLRVGEELRGLMTDHSLEIKASVRLKPFRDESAEAPEAEAPEAEAPDKPDA